MLEIVFWLSPLQNCYNFLKSYPWVIHLSAWEFYCFLIYWFILIREGGKPSGVLVCWLTVLVAAIQFCTDKELQRKSKWLVWSSFLCCSSFGCLWLPTRRMAATSLYFLRPSHFVYKALQTEGHCRCLLQLLLCSFPLTAFTLTMSFYL